MNPAVTLGLAASGITEFVPGVPVGPASIATYLAAEMLGAFIGAVLCWLAYKKQFDEETPAGMKLGRVLDRPEIRSPVWNVVTEAIATFVLVFVVIAAGHSGRLGDQDPGGPGLARGAGRRAADRRRSASAWAAPPATPSTRPVTSGPRIAHAVLPIPRQGRL